MIYLALIILGLSLGSFVNALVWRLYKQAEVKRGKPKDAKRQLEKLSITRGRSMCMHCGHELAPKDLIPVLSWLLLKGQCRYCHKAIDDTPVAEVLLPALFIISYAAWPFADSWNSVEYVLFGTWLLILTCFLALAIYDAKWFILPNKLVLAVTILAAIMVILATAVKGDISILVTALMGALTISGVFWLLSAVSNGTWIGWGDVKLGVALGLIAGSLLQALLVIFIASLLGSLVVLPQILAKQRGLKSSLPFGPHLIISTVIVFLWGDALFSWYFGLLAG